MDPIARYPTTPDRDANHAFDHVAAHAATRFRQHCAIRTHPGDLRHRTKEFGHLEALRQVPEELLSRTGYQQFSSSRSADPIRTATCFVILSIDS